MTKTTFCLLGAVFVVILHSEMVDSSNDGSNNTTNNKYFADITTKDCKLREPVYNHTFDLTPLRSDLGHKLPGLAGRSQRRGADDEFVEFNVCGDLMKLCGGRSGVSACHTRNGNETVIGVSPTLSLRDGLMSFAMDGDKCNSSSKYVTEIKLVCSYEPVAKPIKIMESESCYTQILWFTKHACLPLPTELEHKNCSVIEPTSGHIFNLLPLASQKLPVEWHNASEKILLSVCRPVPYQFAGMCPAGSSVCVVNDNAKTLQEKFRNVGSTVALPSFDQKTHTIYMHMESTEKCSASRNFSSYITFSCDASALIGKPEYISMHNCQYNFNWQTSLACITAKPCVTVDPTTLFTYDLTPLAAKSFNISNQGKSYAFSVCNAAGGPCPAGVGACQLPGSLSGAPLTTVPLGVFNHYLQFNQTGSPYLEYRAGAACDGIQKSWSTRIEFICASEGMVEGPVIVENDNCTLVVHFVTQLVCQKQIMCKVYDWKTNQDVDLSPLMSWKSNYMATVSDELMHSEGPPKLYFLNVCKPLVPQYGLSCKGGSAACMAISSSTTPINEQSLGFADISLTIVDSPRGRRPQLQYLRGGTCPHDQHVQLSSQIEFYCDAKAGRGKPVLKAIAEDCLYEFDWPTNILCPEHAIDLRPASCGVFSNETNIEFDLKTITDNGNIVVNHSPNNYTVNLCNNPSSSVLVNYAESTVKLFFQTKGPCDPEGNIDVELRLACKETTSSSANSDSDACTLVLTIDTPLICPILGIDITIPPVQAPSIQAAHANVSPIGAFLITILTIGSICCLIAFLLYRYPEQRSQLSNWVLRREPVSIQYSRVHHTEPEASILLPQNGRLSDSDDELIV